MQELEIAEPKVPVRPRTAPAEGLRVNRQATRFLPWFAVAILGILLAAAICWAIAHPFGVHWDEAEYFNDVQIDVHRLRSFLFLKFAGRILIKSWGRPPAFRILADPVLALLGFSTLTARLVSLTCFALSVGFVFLTVAKVAGRNAAALSALVFALSPEVVSASMFFGTDTSLYLATAAMFYFMVCIWSGEAEDRKNWIGLGLSIALGFLAKTSFVAIVVPLLAFWFVAGQLKRWNVPNVLTQWKAGLLAAVIAGPWWLVNVKAAVAYGKYARGFVRNSLGTPSLATGLRWLDTVIQCLFGHGIAILLGLLGIAFLIRLLMQKQILFQPLQKAIIGACACAGLPIVFAQLSGTNHLLRHITPAMIPLAIAAGIVFENLNWTCSRAAVALSCGLFCVQLGMLIAPVISPNNQAVNLGFPNAALPWRTMVRFDQWDWTPLRGISDRCNLADPKISYLGNGRAFSKPQIAFPWVVRGASLDLPDPAWLWRYENGPIDWNLLMASADGSDIVVTAPGFIGESAYKENLDNQYNDEFAARLSRDPQFQPPIPLPMGRFQPARVLIFLNKNAVCRAN